MRESGSKLPHSMGAARRRAPVWCARPCVAAAGGCGVAQARLRFLPAARSVCHETPA